MSLVNYSVDASGVARLTLNRAEKLNAFSRTLCDEYLAHLTTIEGEIAKHKIRALLLDTSSDKAFCAGADLKERESMNEAQIDEQLAVQRKMMDRTAALAVPTIAILRGIAFGGGLELALACDFRIAAPGVQMGLTELKLAIIPGSGGTQRLSRLIGLARAREMILLARRVSAETALSYGLVNEVTKDIDTAVKSYTDAILESAPLAQRAAKEALAAGFDLPLKEALNLERKCYDVVLKSKDRVEGLAAFLQKRAPKYQGA